jgi:hypothetical protein
MNPVENTGENPGENTVIGPAKGAGPVRGPRSGSVI